MMDLLPEDKLPKGLIKLEKIKAETKCSEVRQICQATCDNLLKHWRNRLQSEKEQRKKDGKSASVDNSANEFLRKNLYRIGNVLIDQSKVSCIRKLVPEEAERRKNVPSVEENIYHWLLVFMLRDHEEDMFLSVRNRMAKQLLYARRHNIPPYLLVGFLYQVPDSNNLTAKLKDERVRELWFCRLFPHGEYITLKQLKEEEGT